MRIVFLSVTIFWLALTVFVAYWYSEIDITGIRFTVGMATFCLAVCAVLEGLRRIEKRSASTSE